MRSNSRRAFLKTSATLSAAALAGGSAVMTACSGKKKSSSAPAILSNETFEWKMVTTWPPTMPIIQDGSKLIAKWAEEMSGGRLKIQVYGGGELVPSLEAFGAVSQGVAEMGHGSAYYWSGKSPAAQFFAAVPFGMNAQQMNAWIYSGGGQDLWDEVYAPFNLISMPAGNTGFQMGGWFNKEIKSISDFKGLKMRIPGLGGKVLTKAGGAATLSAGGEIYTNLERGVIDATEWVGPYHDYLMGFYKVAKYYYYPGWHEPGTVLELFVNKAKFESLPKDLQQIIKTAAFRANLWMLSEFESKNHEHVQKLVNEHNVKLTPFPDDVLKTLKTYSEEVIDEITSQDALSQKVYASFSQFKKTIHGWADISEKLYYNAIA